MDMDELDYNIRLRMMQNIAEETVTHRHSARDSAVPSGNTARSIPAPAWVARASIGPACASAFCRAYSICALTSPKSTAPRVSPPISRCSDWGVTYDQLEPHYWYAEQMMGVSGKAGNLRGKLIDGGNIFESPRMHEYPTPPLKNSYASHLFEEATRKLGYHPYPTPAANLSENYTNPDGVTRPACAYCGVLFALRLHDRREGAAHQYAAARSAQAQKLSTANRKLGAPHRA